MVKSTPPKTIKSANTNATAEKAKATSGKSGLIEMATLVVGVLTLVLAGFSAWQSIRLDQIEAQIAEARARSEVVHRLFIIDEDQGCGADNRFLLQTNTVWQEFAATTCSLSDRKNRLAGLILEQTGKEELFAPRVNLTFARQSLSAQVLVSDLKEPISVPETVRLTFIEEGEARPVFIPVAVLDADGMIVSTTALWPLSMNWQSPITDENISVKLNWFAPQEQWLSDEGGILGQ